MLCKDYSFWCSPEVGIILVEILQFNGTFLEVEVQNTPWLGFWLKILHVNNLQLQYSCEWTWMGLNKIHYFFFNMTSNRDTLVCWFRNINCCDNLNIVFRAWERTTKTKSPSGFSPILLNLHNFDIKLLSNEISFTQKFVSLQVGLAPILLNLHNFDIKLLFNETSFT